jgi:hypothetical protein
MCDGQFFAEHGPAVPRYTPPDPPIPTRYYTQSAGRPVSMTADERTLRVISEALQAGYEPGSVIAAVNEHARASSLHWSDERAAAEEAKTAAEIAVTRWGGRWVLPPVTARPAVRNVRLGWLRRRVPPRMITSGFAGCTMGAGSEPAKEVSAVGNITITRYPKPEDVGWQGYIEPDDKSWIVFIHQDGHPAVFLNRDPATGGVQ